MRWRWIILAWSPKKREGFQTPSFFVCFFVMLQTYLISIGAYICSGWESCCLPCAGFFLLHQSASIPKLHQQSYLDFLSNGSQVTGDMWNVSNDSWQFFNKISRTTGPGQTLDKEEKHGILPTTLNFAVRRGTLRIYTLQNPPEVFWKFAPPGGYKECAAICFP